MSIIFSRTFCCLICQIKVNLFCYPTINQETQKFSKSSNIKTIHHPWRWWRMALYSSEKLIYFNLHLSLHSRHDIQNLKRLTFSRWRWSIFKTISWTYKDNRRPSPKQPTLPSQQSLRRASRSARTRSAGFQAWSRKWNDAYCSTWATAWAASDSRMFRSKFFHRHPAHQSKTRCRTSRRHPTAITLQTELAAACSSFQQSSKTETLPSSYLSRQPPPNFRCWFRFHHAPLPPDLRHPRATSEPSRGNSRRHLTTRRPVPPIHPTSRWTARPHIKAITTCTSSNSISSNSSNSFCSNSSKDLTARHRRMASKRQSRWWWERQTSISRWKTRRSRGDLGEKHDRSLYIPNTSSLM